MKKITFLAVALGFAISSVAQVEIANRPNDNTTGLITSNGSNDAGVFCADLLTLDSETTLGTFEFIGFSSSGLPLGATIDGVAFFIYADDGGVPASNPSFPGEGLVDLPLIANGDPGFELTVDDGANTNIKINVTAAVGSQVVLPAGDYWMSVATVGAGDSAGDIRWNWQGSLDVIDVEPYLIDTDDLFGAGATDWTNISGLIAESFPSFNVMAFDEVLSNGSNLVENVNIFPNPATDVLNVSVPSNVTIESATLVDILGKNTGATISNGQVDISALASGVYILNVNTNLGSLTHKVIKK
ncbi:MAG: T9SS type A sorting domain-containing protein [Patiriisocius sp.]|uniref:T9SS type A sorting domain-containing protein n=1 Tax=Patiriisocius sp. TaxID=2822396 RepID=UPI003EFA7857